VSPGQKKRIHNSEFPLAVNKQFSSLMCEFTIFDKVWYTSCRHDEPASGTPRTTMVCSFPALCHIVAKGYFLSLTVEVDTANTALVMLSIFAMVHQIVLSPADKSS
jgi:hypothetical protein